MTTKELQLKLAKELENPYKDLAYIRMLRMQLADRAKNDKILKDVANIFNRMKK